MGGVEKDLIWKVGIVMFVKPFLWLKNIAENNESFNLGFLK